MGDHAGTSCLPTDIHSVERMTNSGGSNLDQDIIETASGVKDVEHVFMRRVAISSTSYVNSE